MTTTRQIVSLGFLAGLLASASSAQAGETVIFNGTAPQAAELARILWPSKQRAASPVGATRSIRINPDMAPTASAPRPASHVDYAEAEPVTASDAEYEQVPAAAAPRLTSHVDMAEVAPVAALDAQYEQASEADAFGFLIHFAYDSTEILPQSRPYLDSVGAMLRLPEASGKKVVIVGHTDARGSDQYNQVLSERRAAAVRAYLTAEFGITPDRLEIEGQGETDPISGSDPHAAQNRRVEFHAAG
jgi:outer membrane protein OmpA-like peptidoglycan-associated protein